MDVNDFYKYIESPELLNASTVAELQEVVEVYPYFQTAHFLYLKSLYNQNNFKFNDQLKFSSVHVNNRKKLLFFLKNNLVLEHKKQVIVDDVKTSISIDSKKVEKQAVISKESKKEFSKKLEKESIEKSDSKQEKHYVKQEKAASSIESSRKLPSIQETPLSEERVDKTGDLLAKKKDLSKKESLERKSLKSELKNKPVSIETKIKKENELEQKKSKVFTVQEKNLTPQEIVQRRVDELSKTSKSKVIVSKDQENKSVKLEKEIKSVTQPQPVEDLVKNDEDILADISDLIQIAPPSEYFLEEHKPEKTKSVEKKVSSKSKDIETHSFSYWLNYLQKSNEQTQSEKIIKKKESKAKNNTKKSLIDNFLSDKTSKKIKPKKIEAKVEDLASQNAPKESEEGFMTETLAQIYIKQAYYDKAIESYKKLSLKYPKKNTYFASQIEKIKKLQLNS